MTSRKMTSRGRVRFAKSALATLFLGAAVLLAAASPNLADLLRRSSDADDRNAEIERNYVFQERVETHNGKSTEIETYDTILSGGRPYQRLVARNDKPLSASEDKKEEEKASRKPRGDEEERRRKNRELAHEAQKAFDFRLDGEDAENWILAATPRPGYRPTNRETAILRHFRARLWISKSDFIWTKLDAEAIDSISFGFVIARLNQGAHLVIERTKVNGEVWLPKRIAGGGAGRIALFKKVNIQFETICSRFRRFSSDSHLVPSPSQQ